MLQVTKPEGFGNIQLEEVPMPEINARQIRVETDTTLISRGSELFRRYIMEDAVPPSIMGYSLTGIVDAVGAEVTGYRVGQRVMVVAPHAQYVVAEPNASDGRIVPLFDDVSFEAGTFLPLTTSAVAWSDSSGVKAGDTVVVLGQGLVGSLMMQVLRGYNPARIITVDALPLRCELSTQLGADVSINAGEIDPVDEVRRLADGKGADLVIDCVGGYAGVKSFEQAQDMTRQFGTIQLIALYQQAPLPLHSSKMMSKRLVAGILTDEPRSQIAARALKKIQNGEIRAADMITHRFHYTEAKAAFDLLWNSPGDTLGVLIKWQ
ncbi:zinc-binding dehydrogenase [Candidatus Poribacteria bacterium]|nr:zinc-binding dehydrogenase [Candidatus Poribacteria bacterium]MYB02390.1 zinc-binding dehydrogenase [Candidatus Poribacteria bacterium]